MYLYLYVYIYIYTYIYVCTHTHTHTYSHVYIYKYTYARTLTHTHTHTHTRYLSLYRNDISRRTEASKKSLDLLLDTYATFCVFVRARFCILLAFFLHLFTPTMCDFLKGSPLPTPSSLALS